MSNQAPLAFVNDASFQDQMLDSDIPVVMGIWATWYGPCRQVAPLLDQLAAECDGSWLSIWTYNRRYHRSWG